MTASVLVRLFGNKRNPLWLAVLAIFGDIHAGSGTCGLEGMWLYDKVLAKGLEENKPDLIKCALKTEHAHIAKNRFCQSDNCMFLRSPFPNVILMLKTARPEILKEVDRHGPIAKIIAENFTDDGIVTLLKILKARGVDISPAKSVICELKRPAATKYLEVTCESPPVAKIESNATTANPAGACQFYVSKDIAIGCLPMKEFECRKKKEDFKRFLPGRKCDAKLMAEGKEYWKKEIRIDNGNEASRRKAEETRRRWEAEANGGSVNSCDCEGSRSSCLRNCNSAAGTQYDSRRTASESCINACNMQFNSCRNLTSCR